MSRSLPLAAWSLRPVAWSLMLAACCFRGLALDAWGLRLDASFLVFCNNLDDAIPIYHIVLLLYEFFVQS